MAQYGGNQSGYGQGNRYNQQPANPYGQSQQGGYGSNPYAQQQTASNPYAQQQQPSNPYAQQSGGNMYGGASQYQQVPQQSNAYGRNPYDQREQQQPQAGNYGSRPGDIEMGQVNGAAGQQDTQHQLLEECRAINTALDELSRVKQPRLAQLHQRLLGSTGRDDDPEQKEWTSLDAEIMATYKYLEDRVKRLVKAPGAGSDLNRSQVTRTKDTLKKSLQQFQEIHRAQNKENQEQLRRNLKNANQNLTPQEIEDIVESGQTQVYAMQIQQSSRAGQARTVLSNVNSRSENIQKIARDIEELYRMQLEINEMVIRDEENLVAIVDKTNQVEQDTRVGNEQLTGAVEKARAARRKKWICLGIVVLLILIAVAIGVGAAGQNKQRAYLQNDWGR